MNNFIFGIFIGMIPTLAWLMHLRIRYEEEHRIPNLMRERGRKLVAKGTKLCLTASRLESKYERNEMLFVKR